MTAYASDPILIPCKGCLVKVEGSEIARVIEIRRDSGRCDLKLRMRNGAVSWSDLEELRSGFSVGHEVEYVADRFRGQGFGTGVVQATRTLGGFDQVCIQFQETGATCWLPYETVRLVAPVETRLLKGDCGQYADHAERFRLRVLSKMLETWDANTGAFGRLDIDPLPHQLHVARKVVTSGAPGWLLADDVGLGKTIEVGLILHALNKRGRGRRVLIVCPASLTQQWQDEMMRKFERTFEIYGSNFSPDTPEMLRARDSVIVSIDVAKRDNHSTIFAEGGGWDVIVFDEAHHLGRSETGERTERFRLAERLRLLSPLLLLLTATPHQGKTGRFAALLELARPDMVREIGMIAMEPQVVGDIVIRNYKPDVTDAKGELIFRGHDTQRIMVTPSPEMIAFDRNLRAYLKRGYGIAQASGAGRAIGFVMTTYRKLSSSSLEAIRRALHRRLMRLRNEAIGEGERTSVEDYLTADDLDRDLPLDELKKAFEQAAFFADEPEMVANLVRQADALRGHDAKLTMFLDDVVAPLVICGEALLIFTEYRATQDYLAGAIIARFSEVNKVGLINGSMTSKEKMSVVKAFNAGETQVTVSTEAGAEGLNMQERCHILVNYDLPWNPSRLVQRIGRLYRYGQEKRVQVINLQVDDGFDNHAISMMLERVDAIARDLSAVIEENREALEAQIVGELLSRIDMEDILARAGSVPAERTRDEIDRATQVARDAQEIEMDLLQYADRHHGTAQSGLDGSHMMAFAVGMAPHLGIAVRSLSRDGEVLEIELPEKLVDSLPRFGRRRVLRLTSSPTRARRSEDLEPLDFDNPLVRRMAEEARKRKFDGLMADAKLDIGGSGLCVYLLRWQDLAGTLLEEEIVPVITSAAEHARILPVEKLGSLLLNPWPSTINPRRDKVEISRDAMRDALITHWRAGARINRFPGAESAFAAAHGSQ